MFELVHSSLAQTESATPVEVIQNKFATFVELELTAEAITADMNRIVLGNEYEWVPR